MYSLFIRPTSRGKKTPFDNDRRGPPTRVKRLILASQRWMGCGPADPGCSEKIFDGS